MFLLPTFIICQGGGEANYCYISFIQKNHFTTSLRVFV